ncbi:hypothetical protein [Nocardia sp. NBC_01388]|uniref:hypothetical protein n=1 Tax=Nocardia sp. NBC_01388 TaxID=2903596 RepID=UPI00324F870C
MGVREWRAERIRTRAMYTGAYLRERRRRVAGWLLVAIGVAMATVHVLTHLGDWQLLSSPGRQDLVIGYPTALAIAFVGMLLITTRARSR